jgi:peroxiredoxin Q/BCP
MIGLKTTFLLRTRRRRIVTGLIAALIVGHAAGSTFLMPNLRVGDRAPAFRLPSQAGEIVDSADFLQKRTLVVYFYPKDETTICTKEACGFRDAYEDFVAAGAVVIGVSSDSVDSHRRFAENRKLPFLLLSDADGSLRKAFGVPKTFGIFPGRVTYVIDRDGIVRHVFNSQFQGSKHVAEALQIVRELASNR